MGPRWKPRERAMAWVDYEDKTSGPLLDIVKEHLLPATLELGPALCSEWTELRAAEEFNPDVHNDKNFMMVDKLCEKQPTWSQSKTWVDKRRDRKGGIVLRGIVYIMQDCNDKLAAQKWTKLLGKVFTRAAYGAWFLLKHIS